MEQVQRFLKGMQRDNNPLDYDNQSYVFMENGDIVNDDGESFDSISNLKGNKELEVIWASDVDTGVYPYNQDPKNPYGIHWKIIGSIIIRDDIVLFYANDDLANKASKIDLLKYNGDNYIRITLSTLDFDFQYNKIVHGIGNYERNDIVKVYFSEKSDISYGIRRF